MHHNDVTNTCSSHSCSTSFSSSHSLVLWRRKLPDLVLSVCDVNIDVISIDRCNKTSTIDVYVLRNVRSQLRTCRDALRKLGEKSVLVVEVFEGGGEFGEEC